MSTELEPIDAPMPQLGFLATGPDDRLWLIDYPRTLWTRTTAPDSAWRAVPHRLPDLNRLVGRDPHTGRLAIQHEGQTQVWDPDTASFVPSPDGQYVTQNTPPAPALQQSPAQGAAPHAPDLSGPPFTDGPQWSLDPVAGIRRVRRAAVQTVLPPSDNADNADTPVNVSRLWWDDTTETLWALAAKTRWWPVWSQHPDPRLPEVNPSCPIWTTRYFRDPSEALWLACANLVHRWEGDAWVSDAPPDRGQAGPAWNTRQGLFLGGERSTLAQLTEAGWTTIQDADGKSIPDIYALVELDDGRLIAGGLRGVWLSSPGAPAEVLPELQAIGTVRHLRQDGAWVWISTVDRGLCVLPAATPTAPVRCLDEDSLQDRGTVHTTIEDHRGRTFISTNQGIGVVSSARLQAWAEGSDAPVPYWLGTDHGMATAECNGFVGDAAARTPDGKLWFASQDGVVVVDPRALELPAAPAIQFIEAQTGDTSVLRPTTLHLAADHPPVHLRWSTAAIEDAERVSFRYRVGEAAAWSRLGPGRTLDLPTVPPGDSRLHVQARLGDDWGPVAELSLHRVPHLTERGLFPLLISLLASIVVGLSIAARALMLRWVNRNLERRVQDQTRAIASRNTTLEQLNETLGEQNQTLAEQSTMLQDRATRIAAQARKLEELDDLKRQLIANVSHELRTPLSLILGPMGTLRSETQEPRTRRMLGIAIENAHRLDTLISQLFDIIPRPGRW